MAFTSPAAALRCCIVAAMALVAGSAHADQSRASCGGVDYNKMILDIIKDMPKGGGYTLSDGELKLPTITSNAVGDGKWEMHVFEGHPSHCTSATYTIFAQLAATMQNGGQINLTPAELESLAIQHTMPDGKRRVDGQGPFQIFNSNGAGAAALIKHTGTGISFRDDKFVYARPGDFLKLFWNENVGASERGHQVVFLDHRTVAGREMVCFWGSQRQRHDKQREGGSGPLYFPMVDGDEVVDGYGKVCRPRTDIKAMVFSRVTCMEHLGDGLKAMAVQASAEPGRADLFVDEYLYGLREKSSDHATLNRTYGILAAPAAFADVGTPPPR